jgi:hypothetical protein
MSTHSSSPIIDPLPSTALLICRGGYALSGWVNFKPALLGQFHIGSDKSMVTRIEEEAAEP